ncbi:MAG: hypothetical protein ACOYBY_17700 [Dermatophilaceae bacterium]
MRKFNRFVGGPIGGTTHPKQAHGRPPVFRTRTGAQIRRAYAPRMWYVDGIYVLSGEQGTEIHQGSVVGITHIYEWKTRADYPGTVNPTWRKS